MKRITEFLAEHKKSHIYFTAAIIIAAVLLIGKNSRAFADFLADNITTPLKSVLGAVNSLFPFSVMELILVVLMIGVLVYIILWIRAVVKSGNKLKKFYSGLIAALCIILTLYDAMYLLWGINYHTSTFCEKAGLSDTEISLDELNTATLYFADKLNEAAGSVPRNENGELDVTVNEIFESSTDIYGNIEEKYPFLAFDDKRPKGMMFSRIMSIVNYTGIFFPLTGESNINIDPPVCMMPATVAHELAHRRGIASEKECNFLGVLASVSSGDPVYEYSGWLLGYVYLENALYDADSELAGKVRGKLSASVLADMSANNEFWAQYENTPISEAADTVYDGFLKSYGDEDGIKSYGLVVDLLVKYRAEFT